MKKSHLVVAALAISLALPATGCTNMSKTEQGGLSGAAIGAGVGAGISALTGGRAGLGAAIGGVLGGVAGGIYGHSKEQN